MAYSSRLLSRGILAAAAASLAGCVSGGPANKLTLAPVVDGAWISTDGVAVSTFSGGVFTTTATDTGNKLADGNYTMTDARNVAITVVSRIRNTTTNVNCALASADQLNCTSSTGTNFVLARRTPTA